MNRMRIQRTNLWSVSLCFSWPAALGIKASSSFKTSTATFTSSSSSMVCKVRDQQSNEKKKKQSAHCHITSLQHGSLFSPSNTM